MDRREIVAIGAVAGDGDAAAPYEPVSFSGRPESDAEATQVGGDPEAWRFWHTQITTALVAERRWRQEALHAETTWFGPENDQGEGTARDGANANKISDVTEVIHANIEVLKPLMYSQTPQPIVQRRFRGDGKRTDHTDLMAAEAGQRIAQYLVSTTAFDEVMERVRDDWLIVGRGAARVLYRASFGEQVGPDGLPQAIKADEEVFPVACEWRRFLCAPAASWGRMPWIAFENPMTRTQVERRFPDHAPRFAYNNKGLADSSRGLGTEDRDGRGVTAKMPASGEPVKSPFDTATVWEIWNRDSKEVIWWSPDCSDCILDKEPDALQLEGFWPMPKPILATTVGESMNPRPDMRYYESKAREVEEASRKLSNMLDILAVAGLVPGAVSDTMKKLLSGKNQMIAVTEWLSLIEKGGTREIIQWLPLDTILTCINGLVTLREQAKAAMFEASGISDIMRAQGDPSATATQENLKGKYAGLRVQDRQKRMAIYARDMLRIMVEIAVEMFDTQRLADICGIEIPLTKAERLQLEMQAQMQVQAFAQAQQQYAAIQQAAQAAEQQGLQVGPLPPPPEAPPEPDVPKTSWEEVHDRLRTDMGRKIAITIETSSTVLADESEDRQARVEFIGAFASFVQQILPLAVSGTFPMRVAKEILMFGVRGFRQARTLEGLISELPDEMPDKGPPPEEVQVTVAKIRAETDVLLKKMDMAEGEAERAHDTQMKGVDLAKHAADMDTRNDPPPQPAGAA